MTALSSRTFTARIRSRTGSPVQRIVLEVPPDYAFHAGQYLRVLHPDGDIPLSIASAPRRLPELHLHYRSTPGLAEAQRLDALLAAGDRLEVSEPAGDVLLPAPLADATLIVAGGTGMAQAMSFVDDFTGADPGARVTLLWCVDHPDDAYLRQELTTLDAPWLETVIIADDDRSPDNRGLAWLRSDARAFRAGSVVLAGGPAFVYAAVDALRDAGLDPDLVRSDVFAYAPRPMPRLR
jgi:CDP-4-dehydro-6-deoxyglucose reductase, E3